MILYYIQINIKNNYINISYNIQPLLVILAYSFYQLCTSSIFFFILKEKNEKIIKRNYKL